jgi:hypothetical protein
MVLCAEGLLDTEHPFVFIAQHAFKELCEADGSHRKVIPLLPKLIPHLRAALSSPTDQIFVTGCQSLQSLSDCVGPALDDNMSTMLSPLAKVCGTNPSIRSDLLLN